MMELRPSKNLTKNEAPLAWQMAETTAFLDLAYKYAQGLSDLNSILVWTSVIESTSFFMNILFFISKAYDNQIWYLVLFLGHPARAFVGFALSRILPHS
jgi:hypothetical protein